MTVDSYNIYGRSSKRKHRIVRFNFPYLEDTTETTSIVHAYFDKSWCHQRSLHRLHSFDRPSSTISWSLLALVVYLLTVFVVQCSTKVTGDLRTIRCLPLFPLVAGSAPFRSLSDDCRESLCQLLRARSRRFFKNAENRAVHIAPLETFDMIQDFAPRNRGKRPACIVIGVGTVSHCHCRRGDSYDSCDPWLTVTCWGSATRDDNRILGLTVTDWSRCPETKSLKPKQSSFARLRVQVTPSKTSSFEMKDFIQSFRSGKCCGQISFGSGKTR